ncbi:MAG: ABC transporter permease [Candidatus Latescibacteria bacterium]|nr:ABC transporter permease [Candidatus Latescibacterota bacterium]
MSILRILKVAMSALGRNKMRSGLTMLGIIIGVAAVIAMVAIGQGANSSVQAQIASLGTNVLMLFPGSSNQSGVRMGMGTASSITADDVDAISKNCPAVAGVSPSLRSPAQVVAGNQNWSTTAQGVSPSYTVIKDWAVEEGTFFTDQDIRSATKVCVLGKTVVDNLFGEGSNPVGETIRIKKLPFKVIGVLAKKGGSSMGSDQDDIILAPYTTVQNKLIGRSNRMGMVMVSAVSREMIPEAQAQITALLRARHKLGLFDDDDFVIRNQSDISDAAGAASKVMTTLLASVAGVSLVVGGIGIMNIMLVSVTERIREIGIRMAIGARGRDILFQFLIEAVMVSMIGGIIGIILGVGGSRIISQMAGWPTLISSGSIALAVTFSALVGIFFGFYPARKAAQLDPIDALRYE